MLARWQVASRPSKKLHGTPGWCFGHCKRGCESGISQEFGRFRGFQSFFVCYHKNPRQLELSWCTLHTPIPLASLIPLI
jgi:hypothetical protein